MNNEEYIRLHREEDVRQLALRKAPEGVNRQWCLQQIEGWQLARRKLPRWAATEGVWFPVRLSMEQCSSEATAMYKRTVVEQLTTEDNRLAMADLTGGLGVDFSYMAPLFRRCIYVELQPQLVELARHNMPLLGLPHAEITTPDQSSDSSLFTLHSSFPQSTDSSLFILHSSFPHFSILYIDPSRRDAAGRKTTSIEECTPNLIDLQDELLQHTSWLIAKFSPMLDIREALRKLRCVREVHVVSVGGECKELLFVMEGSPETATGENASPCPSAPRKGEMEQVVIHCVNLGTDEDELTTPLGTPIKNEANPPLTWLDEAEGTFLYEPNASILKAGVSDVLSERYPLRKLHPMSHLFVGDAPLLDFPGRRVRIVDWSDFGKQNLRHFIDKMYQDSRLSDGDKPMTSSAQSSGRKRLKANLAVRNFPTSVATLRRQLKLDEGGEAYLFATTLGNGQHVLIRCRKV